MVVKYYIACPKSKPREIPECVIDWRSLLSGLQGQIFNQVQHQTAHEPRCRLVFHQGIMFLLGASPKPLFSLLDQFCSWEGVQSIRVFGCSVELLWEETFSANLLHHPSGEDTPKYLNFHISHLMWCGGLRLKTFFFIGMSWRLKTVWLSQSA